MKYNSYKLKEGAWLSTFKQIRLSSKMRSWSWKWDLLLYSYNTSFLFLNLGRRKIHKQHYIFVKHIVIVKLTNLRKPAIVANLTGIKRANCLFLETSRAVNLGWLISSSIIKYYLTFKSNFYNFYKSNWPRHDCMPVIFVP